MTKDLFQKYPSVEAFADTDLKELEQDIKPTGFYHNKAKNIIACMKDIRDKYNGEVPSELEDLLSLAGVGRKTANVIRGNIYHVPSVVVDTCKAHIQSARTYENQDPDKIEQDLMKELPVDHWILWNIHIITFGRTICSARSPKCEDCFLQKYCKEYKCREIRCCSVKIFTESNRTMIKEGRKMNFNNKKTRRIVSIVVLIVIIAMVATMIIPYLV